MLGLEIKTARLRAGMRWQRNLADRVGSSLHHMSAVEQGKVVPGRELLDRIATECRVSPDVRAQWHAMREEFADRMRELRGKVAGGLDE